MALGTATRMWTLEEYVRQYDKLKKQVNSLLQGKHYHDVWCNTSRDLPMGCEGCSCAMYKRVLKAEKEKVELVNGIKDARELLMAIEGLRYG